MNKTYLVIDFSNMFHRMKHTSSKGASLDERLGLVIHQMLVGVRSAWMRFNADHVVFALEGKSWRKHIYPAYKMNRVAQRLKRKPSEIEADEEFMKVENQFIEYLMKNTNCSVIRSKNAEGDDIIATFIKDRPDDNHIIVSSDKDFYQLVNEQVKIYDAMQGQIITRDGLFDDRMRPIIDKKTKQQKTLGDPEWLLFEKCIRGDSSDNIFSAYPRVRKKGTKNKVGLLEAFDDRHSKGYEWNSIMKHTWEDNKGNKKVVKDEYEMNKLLIDLSLIPDFIEDEIRKDIEKETTKSVDTSSIGFQFMKLCSKFDLIQLSETSSYYVEFLGKRYVE